MAGGVVSGGLRAMLTNVLRDARHFTPASVRGTPRLSIVDRGQGPEVMLEVLDDGGESLIEVWSGPLGMGRSATLAGGEITILVEMRGG